MSHHVPFRLFRHSVVATTAVAILFAVGTAEAQSRRGQLPTIEVNLEVLKTLRNGNAAGRRDVVLTQPSPQRAPLQPQQIQPAPRGSTPASTPAQVAGQPVAPARFEPARPAEAPKQLLAVPAAKPSAPAPQQLAVPQSLTPPPAAAQAEAPVAVAVAPATPRLTPEPVLPKLPVTEPVVKKLDVAPEKPEAIAEKPKENIRQAETAAKAAPPAKVAAAAKVPEPKPEAPEAVAAEKADKQPPRDMASLARQTKEDPVKRPETLPAPPSLEDLKVEAGLASTPENKTPENKIPDKPEDLPLPQVDEKAEAVTPPPLPPALPLLPDAKSSVAAKSSEAALVPLPALSQDAKVAEKVPELPAAIEPPKAEAAKPETLAELPELAEQEPAAIPAEPEEQGLFAGLTDKIAGIFSKDEKPQVVPEPVVPVTEQAPALEEAFVKPDLPPLPPLAGVTAEKSPSGLPSLPGPEAVEAPAAIARAEKLPLPSLDALKGSDGQDTVLPQLPKVTSKSQPVEPVAQKDLPLPELPPISALPPLPDGDELLPIPPAPPPMAVPPLPKAASTKETEVPRKTDRPEELTLAALPPEPSPALKAADKPVPLLPPPAAEANAAPATKGGAVGQGKNEAGKSVIHLYFDRDGKNVTPEMQGALNEVADILKADSDKILLLTSYAGSEADNASVSKKIALARAMDVRRYLIEAGVNLGEKRIQPKALGNQGGGDRPERIDLTIQ